MNDVKLLGRLTADPETRYTATGDPVSRFCLAVNAGKDANGNNTAEFFNIVTFKNQAEFTTKYLTKGRQIVISGRLHNNRWTKDGQNHVSTEVIADRIYFADSKQTDSQGRPQPAPDDGFMHIPEGAGDELPFN